MVWNKNKSFTKRTPNTAVKAMLIGSIDSPKPPSAHGKAIDIEPESAFTCCKANTMVTNRALARRKNRHTVFLKIVNNRLENTAYNFTEVSL